MDHGKAWEAPVALEVSRLPNALGTCIGGSSQMLDDNCTDGLLATLPGAVCSTGFGALGDCSVGTAGAI